MDGNYSDFTKSQQTNSPLKPKRVASYRKIWLQLKDNGYDVIPLGAGKDKPPKGWPTLSNSPDDIEKWTGKAAAIRLYGHDLLFIDLDVLRGDLRNVMVSLIKTRWPKFYKDCLKRHSGAVKIGFLGRVKTEKRYLSTFRYPDGDGSHRVEVFTGNCKRYIAVHGMHSPGREYGYDDRSILDVPVADLPWFPEADLGALVDACDQVMQDAGLGPVLPEMGKAPGMLIYSITDATRFDVNNGESGIDYDALVELAGGREEVRVSSSFIDGGGNRTRCRVDYCRIARCIGVWDTDTEAWHCPASAAPEAIVEGLADPLKKLAEEVGATLKPSLPNWRERYKGSAQPRASLHNAKLAIQAAGVICSEDVFHSRLLLGRRNGGAIFDAAIGEVNDSRVALLRGWLSNTYGFDLTERHIRDAVLEMCALNQFDPVCDMLDEAEVNWDGVERLDRMAVEHFNSEDTPLNRAFARKFMLGAVARARHPGCKFDEILTLEAPQGWNKSSSLKVLAGDDNFADAKVLGKDSKEVMELSAGAWIVEISELAGMRRTAVEDVKNFASRATDKARPAYGHFVTIRPRRFVVAGTTNSNRYLQSQTGNRRFWPLKLGRPIDLQKLREARLQLWGEAAHYQRNGESLTLPESLWAAAGAEQEERRVVHGWETLLASILPSSIYVIRNGNKLSISTHDLLVSVLRMPEWRITGEHSLIIEEAMWNLGWTAEGQGAVSRYVKLN